MTDIEKVIEMRRKGSEFLEKLHAHLSTKHALIQTHVFVAQNIGDRPLILEIKKLDKHNFYLSSLTNMFNVLHIEHDEINFTTAGGPEELWALIIARDAKTLALGLAVFTAAAKDFGGILMEDMRRIE